MENKKLENKLLLMSNQTAILERSLQNVHSLNFAEVLVHGSVCLTRDKNLSLILKNKTSEAAKNDPSPSKPLNYLNLILI